MNALIAPNQPSGLGWRVAEVSQQPFEIAPPLFWTPCSDDVVADLYYYDPQDQQIKSAPESQPSAQPAQPAQTGADEL